MKTHAVTKEITRTPYGTEEHYLECAHQIGISRKVYYMRCEVLKAMPDGRLKVRVYGDRNWRGYEDKSRIRYVQPNRVRVLLETNR